MSTDRVPQWMLERWVAKWQKILRVQDWDVEIGYKRRWEMEREHVSGLCEMLQQKRTAKIQVLDDADRDPEEWPYDPPEQLVIHEVLHLHTDGMKLEADTPAWEAMEQLVHAVARALYALGGDSKDGGER